VTVNPIFFLGEIPKHPIRDPLGSTWPNHFSKADDGSAVGCEDPGLISGEKSKLYDHAGYTNVTDR